MGLGVYTLHWVTSRLSLICVGGVLADYGEQSKDHAISRLKFMHLVLQALLAWFIG